ncbi:Uma2 family endonuclease [Nostoc sp.]|uniref:Uma2 family endonuclease n=1 Tax=Nostoc sp. TaxID=1180 RepID=UPI002FFCCD11
MKQAIEGVRWTIHDLEVLPENEWTRYEIINGELFVTRPPHRRHQQVCVKIARQLDVWSDSSGLGETIDDFDKIEILAELFLNLIKEKINLETFRRLASAVNIAFVEDLNKLIKNNNNNDYLGNLIGSGLTEVSSTGIIISGYDVVHNSVRICALGKLFVRLMNNKN